MDGWMDGWASSLARLDHRKCLNQPESCKIKWAWLFAPTPIAVSSGLIISKWQQSTCILSFWQICFSEAMWRLWLLKSLKICSGLSGTEAEKGLWVFIMLCKSHSVDSMPESVFTVWLEWVRRGNCLDGDCDCEEYFREKQFTTCVRYMNTLKETDKL